MGIRREEARKMSSAIEDLFEVWKNEVGLVCTPEELRKLGGGRVGFNTQVTRDSIRHFVDAIGDRNSLFCDGNYAKKSKYGCLIAPPCFLCTTMLGPVVFRKPIPGVIQGVDSGAAWEWLRPLCEGDELSCRITAPSDVQLKASKHVGKMAVYFGRAEIFRQRGELVAIHDYWVIHIERQENTGPEKLVETAEMQEYTEEDIKEIYSLQDKETPRGSFPRYWEDTEVGDELTPVIRGPFTLTDAIAWAVGGVGIPCELIYRLNTDSETRTSSFLDPTLKVQLSPVIGHFDSVWAKKVGAPGAFDFGNRRISLLGTLLTNWAGDEGFLWKLKAETRKFVVIGDTVWCKGKVIRKYRNEGRFCVDIDCWVENQKGVIVTPAKAAVILPSREEGAVIYPDSSRNSKEM
jgi:acyl dehydratase